MFDDTTSEREMICFCMDKESTEQLLPLTEPVELDDADLDAVVGGVLCCGAVSCSSFSKGSLCCSN